MVVWVVWVVWYLMLWSTLRVVVSLGRQSKSGMLVWPANTQLANPPQEHSNEFSSWVASAWC